MSDDPYSILEVSRHATDAEIERAYDRMLQLFDPERYPGSTEDAYKRLAKVNAAYAEIRGGATSEVVEPEDAAEPDNSEPIDRTNTDGRKAAIADNLVRIGFISSAVPQRSNPAVEVLATLLPPGAEIGVCLTCLGVKANGRYKCQETSGSFTAMTVMGRDVPYATGDRVHPIARTEIVLCTNDELSWTVSRYAGQRTDDVMLYSIPFTDIVGAAVRSRKHDVADVWIDAGPTISIHTRPREADALCDCIERAVAS